MKYVVIDIETGGIPGKDGTLEELQILEFGAIIEDSENPLAYNDIPKYNKIIRHEQYTGGAFAINLNQRIFKILADRENYRGDGRQEYDAKFEILKLSELAKDFFEFLYPHFGEFPEGDDFSTALKQVNKYKQAPFVITPAGKNFDAFDRNFIKLIPKWGSYVNLRHRTIDPTSMFIDWEKDTAPPGLGLCMERAGCPGIVTHKAVDDCWDTLQVIRKDYKIDKPFKKENILRQIKSELSKITEEALERKVEASGLTEEVQKKALKIILKRLGDDVSISEEDLIKAIKEESDILNSENNEK